MQEAQDVLDPELVELGHRLESLRVRARDAAGKRLSLRAVSVAVGISPTMISDYERGLAEPSPRRLRRLCDYYGVTLDWLTEELGTKRVIPNGEPQLYGIEGGKTTGQRPIQGVLMRQLWD